MGFIDIEGDMNYILKKLIPLDTRQMEELALFMLAYHDWVQDYKPSDYNSVRKPPKYVEIVMEQRKKDSNKP